MNITETSNALALAQAFDNRTVGEANIRAWYAVLGDLDAADVMRAIQEHYAAKTEWIMPATIRAAAAAYELERRKAATKWAPGQYGVPKGEALPEIAGPIAEADVTPEVRALLESVRAMLPEGSREALMPRTVAWERKHAAYRRQQEAQPNPRYRPRTLAEVQGEASWVCCTNDTCRCEPGECVCG